MTYFLEGFSALAGAEKEGAHTTHLAKNSKPY
jgi:hypothetical protein